MNWETIYNQHKDTLLIEEIEMKWREESMLHYPTERLNGGIDGVLINERAEFLMTEDGHYIAY
jgi:hypothetical protein